MSRIGNKRALGVALALTLASIHSPSAFAQSASDRVDPAAVLPSGAVCMSRVIRDDNRFWIIVPSKDVRTMVAKGFVPGPCRMAFGSQEQREAWRDQICHIASSWREDLQDHFEKTRGERPAVLCGMAELAVSQWTKERTR
jgi:hypothetical protein